MDNLIRETTRRSNLWDNTAWCDSNFMIYVVKDLLKGDALLNTMVLRDEEELVRYPHLFRSSEDLVQYPSDDGVQDLMGGNKAKKQDYNPGLQERRLSYLQGPT